MLSGDQILKKVTTLQPRLFASDSIFQLSKVNLVAAACPYGLEITVPNQAEGLPIVIAKNRLAFGQLSKLQYVPSGVIVCGMQMRNKMMKNGFLHAWAWVEHGIFEKPLPALDNKTLGVGIQAALNDAASGVHASVRGIPTCIMVSPFDGKVQFQIGAQTYRASFELNCSKEFVQLIGAPKPCF